MAAQARFLQQQRVKVLPLFILTRHKVGWFILALMPQTLAHIAHHILLSQAAEAAEARK
jgi:hypothetical protein